jgi:hypothetical protein
MFRGNTALHFNHQASGQALLISMATVNDFQYKRIFPLGQNI